MPVLPRIVSPKTIAVDLTPILPGGENGGARIFVQELLARLAESAPQTRFILLTQAISHDQLAGLDRPNMQRRMVVGHFVGGTLRPRLLALANWLLPHLPSRPRHAISHLGYAVNARLKRGGSRGLMRQLDVDLLFCPFTAPTYWEPGLATVCTLYDLQYTAYPEFFAAEDIAHRDQTFRAACQRASVLVAISEHARATAMRHADLDPTRIRTIHLRMARRLASSGRQETAILSRLGLESGRYLIYPANFWPHKNHARLFAAFDIATRSGLPETMKLVCTGAPGPRQSMLRDLAGALGLEERICFPGYLSDPRLAALMTQATGLMFPSLYEGFGLPLIEAMAAGIPVACSHAAALPEVAGDAALLFDPTSTASIAEAMIALARDDNRRAQLIQAGNARADEFSDVQRMAADYWEVFQQALAPGAAMSTVMGAMRLKS
jgi:glycosyltransferase involved in cell wall biosynthesis